MSKLYENQKFAVLVWGPLMSYKCSSPMSLEDAFYMREDLIEKGISSEQYSRIVQLMEPEQLRSHLAM